MKKTVYLLLVLIFSVCNLNAANTAQVRAERLKLGMNLSYLDNYWLGTKENKFADFAKASEAAKREKMFADIKKNGFDTVRIPICFGAWMNLKAPYDWNNQKGLELADSFIKWGLDNGLNVIIDLHHTEYDNTIPNTATTERLVALWTRIAKRYKHLDPEKVFFELRNEPHDISAELWRAQADELIKTVREIAPRHTMIVGFDDWNSRAAMIRSEPFSDQNIIYTFHYYDPFVFTHQGATWAGEGLPELKNLGFPWSESGMPNIPSTAKGKWVENLLNSYKEDSQADKMFKDLKAAKTWSEKHDAPIFLGEFGSFSKFAATEDRCRHAEAVYSALGKLNLPNAWWEWDGGFNMFKTGTTEISDCMRKAIDSFSQEI